MTNAIRLNSLSGDELSALICACQLAEETERRGNRVRPPWNKSGASAHQKLIEAEKDHSKERDEKRD